MKKEFKKLLVLSVFALSSAAGLVVFNKVNNINVKDVIKTVSKKASLVIHEHLLKDDDEIFFVNSLHNDTLALNREVSKKVNLSYVDPTTLSFPTADVETFYVRKLENSTFAFKNQKDQYLAADSFSLGLTSEDKITSNSKWHIEIDHDFIAILKLHSDNNDNQNKGSNVQYLSYKPEQAKFYLASADTISNVQIYKLNNEEVTLELINLPYRVNYRIGETLEPAGLEVKLRYPDGTVRPDYQDYSITYPADTFDSLGMKYITVTSNEYASATVQFTIELCNPGQVIYEMNVDDYDIAIDKNKTGIHTYDDSPHVIRDNNKNEWIMNAGNRTPGNTTFGAPAGYEQFLTPKGAFMHFSDFKRSNHLMAIFGMRNFNINGANGVEFHFATPTGFDQPLYANIAYTNDFGITWNMALTRDVDVRGLSKVCFAVPTSVNSNVGFAVYFQYPEAFTIEDLYVKIYGASTTISSVDPQFIEISAHDDLFLFTGDTYPLSGGIFPLNHNRDAYHKNTLDWIVSDPTVATVNSDTGIVTAVGPGTTTLTMTIHNDPSFTDSIDIHVEARPTGISISPDSKHQTVFPLHTEFNYDGLVVLKDYDNGEQEIRDSDFTVTLDYPFTFKKQLF